MPHDHPFAVWPALALSFAACAPATAATITEQLDVTLVGLLRDTGTVGASATMTEGGRTLWSGAAGLADPAGGVAFTPDTLSSVASVTKLFTAAIVTRLAEDGLIALNDPIAPYVPAGIPAADRVTIRHLVEMRAGYADVEALPDIQAATRDPNHVWTREELFAPIAEPQFEPGSQYDYSNTNYLLLGQVIDSVYPGGTAAAFQDYIARPASLGRDVVWTRDADVAGRVAHGFSTMGGVTTDVSAGALDLGVSTSVWGTIWTDGGIVATSGGLALFADALYGGSLLNEENTAAQVICAYEFSGRCWTGFVGAFNGYSSFILHDADRDVTISLVANSLNEDDLAQFEFLPGLVGAYDEVFEQPSAIPVPASLPLLAAGMAGLTGLAGLRRCRSEGKAKGLA